MTAPTPNPMEHKRDQADPGPLREHSRGASQPEHLYFSHHTPTLSHCPWGSHRSASEILKSRLFKKKFFSDHPRGEGEQVKVSPEEEAGTSHQGVQARGRGLGPAPQAEWPRV